MIQSDLLHRENIRITRLKDWFLLVQFVITKLWVLNRALSKNFAVDLKGAIVLSVHSSAIFYSYFNNWPKNYPEIGMKEV
jgi:hypothetical protein